MKLHAMLITLFLFNLGFSQSVDFTVNTGSYGGCFAPRNVFAVWVTDSNDVFVKSLLVRASNFKSKLFKWNTMSSANVVDAVTGASFTTRDSSLDQGVRTATWDCKNVNGIEVADGDYKIYMEMNQGNINGGNRWASVNFTKGNVNDLVTSSDLSFAEPSNPCYSSALSSTMHKVYSSIQVNYNAPAGILDNSKNIIINDLSVQPNPFNPTTTLKYSIQVSELIQVNVYNSNGKLITNLVNSIKSVGNHSILWNGKNSEGKSVAAGIYLFELKSANKTLQKRVTLLK